MPLADSSTATPSDLALFAAVGVVLGLVTVGQGRLYRWRRSRGKAPVLPGWAPGGWWPRHPTTTVRAGWTAAGVGGALLVLALYRWFTG